VAFTRLSACHRFIVIDGLHVDRAVLATLEAWAAKRGVSVQDAIQLSICFFNERCRAVDAAAILPKAMHDP
jgi:hypothetical protein